MDFLDPNKKKSNRIKLYLGYFLIAIAISLGALVLLFANAGYRVDTYGNVSQNGMVFINSHPSNANIYVENTQNNFKTQAKTDTRLELREGVYKITLQKDGYRDWQREIMLDGGMVERLAYPMLFPKDLKYKDLKVYDTSPKLVSSSPDRKWIIVQKPDNFLMFDVFNAGEPEKPATAFNIPNNLLTPAKNTQSLEVVEWSSDNTNILMKHKFDDKNEFVIINKDKPEESINLNNLTGQQPYDVSLKDRKINQLFLHMAPDGLLQQIDIKTKVLKPVVNHAFSFKSHGDDMLVYVEPNANNPDTVNVQLKSKDKIYTLRELPAKTTYVTDVTKYNDAWYVVVGAASDNKVYVYKNPITLLDDANRKPVFARTIIINQPKKVSFSANASKIAVQSDQNFAVLDLETVRLFRYTIKEKFDNDRPVKWMDGHRLVTSTDKTVIVFDFDGINIQKLMPIDSATNVMFDRDYENAFTLTPADADGKAKLVQTKLLVSDL